MIALQDGIVVNGRVDELVVVRLIFIGVHPVHRLLVDPQLLDPAPADAHGVRDARHAWAHAWDRAAVATFHRIVNPVAELTKFLEADEGELRG